MIQRLSSPFHAPRDLSNGNAISDLNEDLNEISRWYCANSLLSNKSGKNEGSSDLGLAISLSYEGLLKSAIFGYYFVNNVKNLSDVEIIFSNI
jgi:hypothetical protein